MNIAVLHRQSWLAPLGVCALVLPLVAGGDGARALLRYDRSGLAAGQWWRLLSGHLVHLGLEHALLNLAGVWLMWALFRNDWSARRWLLIVLCAIAAIDAGLWMLSSTVEWYVGSSGVLHGVLTAGIVAWIRDRRPEGWVLAVLLAGKLAWEQVHGALPLTAGGVVITQAHLYGVVGGLAVALVPGGRRKPV